MIISASASLTVEQNTVTPANKARCANMPWCNMQWSTSQLKVADHVNDEGAFFRKIVSLSENFGAESMRRPLIRDCSNIAMRFAWAFAEPK